MKIAAPHLANLLDFVSTLGIAPEEIKKTFLSNPDTDLSLTGNMISSGEMVAVVKELVFRSGNEHFGLHYGYFMNLKALGLIYQISRSATDIGQAFFFLKDFLEKTFSVFNVNVLSHDQKTCISLSCSVEDKKINRHLADASLTIMYRELKLMTGSDYKIEISYPAPELQEYKKLLGDEVRQGNEHALLFDSHTMNAALSKKNINALAELLPSFLQLLEQNPMSYSFSARVRKMILNMCTPELPGMEKVASQFCMSPRTFQRKLTEEGKPFRVLTNEIKQDLSKYLQKSERLKTQEIALLLGYSGASAYLHAAKKWQVRG